MTKSAAQQHRRRVSQWRKAGAAVEAAGLPMTVAICITWSACEAADRNDGNILGLPENERVNVVWDRMRRLAAEFGAEAWIAARAPEHDREKGLHLHVGARIPAAAHLRLIGLIERLTGAPADKVYTAPATVIHRGRKCKGVMAHGQLGAWMIQRNLRAGTGGTEGLMRYLRKAPKAAETSAQFRLSQDMLRIARAHG